MRLKQYFDEIEGVSQFAKRTGLPLRNLYNWANGEPPLSAALKIIKHTKGKITLRELAKESENAQQKNQ